jgi:hypothetical protein
VAGTFAIEPKPNPFRDLLAKAQRRKQKEFEKEMEEMFLPLAEQIAKKMDDARTTVLQENGLEAATKKKKKRKKKKKKKTTPAQDDGNTGPVEEISTG